MPGFHSGNRGSIDQQLRIIYQSCSTEVRGDAQVFDQTRNIDGCLDVGQNRVEGEFAGSEGLSSYCFQGSLRNGWTPLSAKRSHEGRRIAGERTARTLVWVASSPAMMVSCISESVTLKNTIKALNDGPDQQPIADW